MSDTEMSLRYGMNPNQKPARIFVENGKLPFEVLSGSPGYINMLDALNSWQLVMELKQALNLPAAASFKHVSPAGAAVGIPLSDTLRKVYFVDDMELSPLAEAYARARGADRVSSYGDFAAVSDEVDLPTARLLNREVSDGVIAPGFSGEALELLRKKKNGRYLLIQMDPAYRAPEQETRQVFGIQFEQKHNDFLIDANMMQNVVTAKKDLPQEAVRDLIVATIALKYTQSNSVDFAVDGQAIGIGAGQQSRIHCARLAGEKADRWWLRQHPTVLGFSWKKGCVRAQKNNAIDIYLQDKITDLEKRNLSDVLETVPPQLTAAEKGKWLAGLDGVSMSSDAFMPFRDTVDRASRSGVKYVVQPGNSLRDDEVIKACDEYGMTMVFTGTRLFHH